LRKDYDSALKDYDSAIRKPPVAVDVYRFKADALRAVQQDSRNLDRKTAKTLDLAELTALTQYLENSGKKTSEVYRQRGAIHVRLNQFAEAQADFSEAIRRKPDSANYMARGWLHLVIQANAEALKDFEESIRLDDQNADAYFGCALIRAKQWSPKQGLPVQAIADVNKGLDNGRKAGGNHFRMMWNASHVYAQLAGAITPAQVTQNSAVKKTRGELESKAVKLLEAAFDELPVKERSGYWDRQIASDKLLDSIRNHPRFKELEREVRKTR
jgi:tetratricopeptide (TPR) repeat protein